MILTILAIIVVLAAIIGILWTVHRQEELDEMEAELTAQSIALDERANRISADEQTTIMLNMRLREELKKREGKVWQACYAVSDSDIIKYDSEGAMLKFVKRRLASVIAEDIVRNFPVPAKEEDAGGRTKYVYRLKVTPADGEPYSRQ